jgi:hypothetical protein
MRGSIQPAHNAFSKVVDANSKQRRRVADLDRPEKNRTIDEAQRK